MFSDNFDGEVEGTSPPANWPNDSAAPAYNEVDDAYCVSSPHSNWISANGSPSNWRHNYHDVSYNGTGKISVKCRLGALAKYYMLMRLQDASGGYGSGKLINVFYFDLSNNIKMYDGGTLTDTGYDYTAGSFKLFEIQINWGAETIDAWYDGDLIADDWSFKESGATSVEEICNTVHGAHNSEMWLDDWQVGEASGWSGTYLGIDNPSKINGVAKETVDKVNGVQSA